MSPKHIEAARLDYQKWLHETGFTEPFVHALSTNKADQVPFPADVSSVKVGDSAIAGQGILASRDIRAGEVLAPARIHGMRTPAGSKTNHSPNANAEFVRTQGEGLDMVATHSIRAGDEVTVNYRQVGRVNGWDQYR